jgi:uncharacterized delta-60 repeat protein
MRMWRSLFLIVLAWCAGIGLVPGTKAAEPVLPTTVDETFRYGDTNVTEIRDIELFPDGRIAYGGVGPNVTAGIALPDGTPAWPHNFSGSFLTVTKSVAVDTADGAFFIGGLPRPGWDWVVERIAFGNDVGWTAKANVGGLGSKVLVLADRDILAVGRLRVAGDTNSYGLVRLDLEGTLDAEFQYTNSLGLEVLTAAVMGDGSVLGSYQQTNENFVTYGFGKWLRNGQRDSTYNDLWALSFGTNSHVTVIEKAAGTNGFVAAVETEPVGAGGPKVTKLVVLDEQGNEVGSLLETPFIEGAVHAIAFEAASPETVASHGYDRVLVGGDFNKVEETSCNDLASVTKEGIVAWGFESEAGPSAPIYAVEVQLDGKVLIGGAFTNVNGIEALGMARIFGSSEAADRLYWADEEFRGFEKFGEVQMTLKRSGNLDEPLTVELGRPLNAANDVTIPNTVEFAAGQSVATIPVTIQNDLIAETRERFEVTAIVTNENILLTRERTELVVLDDETPGTLDPTLQIPEMLGLTAFTFQPDGKILFHGSGRNIVRLNPDGTIDPNFITNALPTTGNSTPVIHQAIVQPDGKILVAGTFVTMSFGQYGRNNLARLNADGTLDLSFDPRLRAAIGSSSEPSVKALLLDDGDILIWLGGNLGGNDREGVLTTIGIIRLDRYGNLVGTYASSTKFRNNSEWDLASSGELITYGNSSGPAQLRKYNADRSVDTNFVATVAQGFVYDVELLGNTLWIGGNFQTVNSNVRPNLAVLNLTTGALDPNGDLAVNGEVDAIRPSGGKIYIGGSFTKVNGVERFRIARLNLDGSLDASFDPGNGPNRSIRLIEFQTDGKPLIGSGFDRVDGVPTSWYVRLEGEQTSGVIRFVTERIELSETNEFVTIEVERIGGSSGALSAQLVTVEGSALAGQHFTATNVFVNYADGEFGRRMLRIPIFADPTETGPRTFSVVLRAHGGGSELTVLLRDAERRLVTGTTFLTGGTNGTNDVRDVAVGADGFVYAVGNFLSVDGVAATNVVRFYENLTVDSSFALEALLHYGSGTPAPIQTMTVRTNGKVVLGGDFTRLGENASAGLAQVNPDGSFDDLFNANYTVSVGGTLESNRELLVQPDDKLIVNSMGTRLRRVNTDGTIDTGFQSASIGSITKSVVGPDGMIYVVRNATGVNGQVIRIDSRGQTAQTIITATHRTSSGLTQSGRINEMAMEKDGALLIGGDFTHLNQTNMAPRLARVSTNGLVDTNFVAQVGVTGLTPRDTITAIEVLASGEILIGGKFTYVDQKMRPTLALLRRDGSMSDDFDPLVQGSGIAEFERASDGVVVRGAVTSVDGIPVGDIFKLGFANPLPPVAKFLWPTNGAEIRVSDIVEPIQVHAFDPDGFIEQSVLELDGVAVATNSSGNVPFLWSLPASGEHQLRMTVTDATGLTAIETVTFRTVKVDFPGVITVKRDNEELVINYGGAGLQESSDLRNWTQVHAGGGEYRTTAAGDYRFYRSTH